MSPHITRLVVRCECDVTIVYSSQYVKFALHFYMGRGGIVFKMNSQSREYGFESSCCHFEAWAILFTPHCSSSLGCINEYLAIDMGGYLNE